MKKLISLTIALVLVLSVGMTTVNANGWGNGSVPPGLAKKIFSDIDSYKWAEKYIEKLFQKGFIFGIGDNKFAPQASVTKIEAIIMSLRVLGWEDEAKEITQLPKNYKGDKVDKWATGYVTLAYEKGILDDVDMMYFKPAAPALRHEVAKYVIRALGYEKEAQRNMDKDLPFVDALAIPQGSVGYVYLANEFKLMQGDNQKRFNPMGTMTRAEMAVLFSRLDDKVDTGKDGTVSGEVSRVYNDKILVKVKDKVESYVLDSKVRVYENNKRIDIDDIKIGSKVVLEILDGKVVFIEVVDKIEDDKIITRYSGIVKEISKTKPYKLAIQAETMVIGFEVVNDVEVNFKDGKGYFEDINKDDEVTVVVDRINRVIKIDVARKYVKPIVNIKGKITDIELNRRYNKITIDKKTYDLAADAIVKIDGRSKELKDLLVGMYVEVEIENDLVVYIEAKNVEEIINGELIYISKDAKLKIKENKTNKEYTYPVDENAKIYIKGVINPKLEDLRIGYKGEFQVFNDVIVEIYIDKVYEVELIKGNIKNIELNRRYNKITIDKKTYDLAADAIVKIDGRSKELKDLLAGMYAEVEIENNLVVYIEAKNVEKEIEGTIVDIITKNKETTLKIKEDDTGKTYTFLVHKEAEIEIEGMRRPTINDLLVGDEGEFKILNDLIVKIEIEIED